MKTTKGQLRTIVRETLYEFWGKKSAAQPDTSRSWKLPLTTASEKMSEVVQALWGLNDNPPRPDLLKKATSLMKELKAAAEDER